MESESLDIENQPHHHIVERSKLIKPINNDVDMNSEKALMQMKERFVLAEILEPKKKGLAVRQTKGVIPVLSQQTQPLQAAPKGQSFQIFKDDEEKIEVDLDNCENKENTTLSAQDNSLQEFITENENINGLKYLNIEENVDISCEESLMQIECEDETEFEQSSEIEPLRESSSTSFSDEILLKCKEFTDEIHNYLLKCERRFLPDPLYMTKQPEINGKMRSILVDWMVEVTEEYKLLDETLFLAINYIDRFLSYMSIARQSFQLLGTTALFIASKYEEIYPPDINEFVYITDDSYDKHQILNMEKLILKLLQFDVSPPTIHYFLRKYASELNIPDEAKHLAEYLCYLTLLEAEPFLEFFPSEVSLCSIILSLKTYGYQDKISPSFLESTLVLEKQISPDVCSLLMSRQSCLEALLKMQELAAKHPQQAIQQKYSTAKFSNVSLIKAIPEVTKVFTISKSEESIAE